MQRKPIHANAEQKVPRQVQSVSLLPEKTVLTPVQSVFAALPLSFFEHGCILVVYSMQDVGVIKYLTKSKLH